MPLTDWPAGTFDLQGNFPPVLANVYLWPGLFADTLPVYLNISRALAQPGPASYVHIDCDIYSGESTAGQQACMTLMTSTELCMACAGARDVLQLLTAADKIVVGTIVVFDDLVRPAMHASGAHMQCMHAALTAAWRGRSIMEHTGTVS